MDGHDLDLEGEMFDVSGSQFGVMLFPDLPRALKEMARVTKPGARVMLIVYGARGGGVPRLLHGRLQAVVPGFTRSPEDPPPVEFQVSDPRRLHDALARAGLKDIRVEVAAEKLAFRSGRQMWDWVTNSNPIGQILVADLTGEQRADVREVLNGMLRERSGGNEPAVLSSPVHIGIGTK